MATTNTNPGTRIDDIAGSIHRIRTLVPQPDESGALKEWQVRT